MSLDAIARLERYAFGPPVVLSIPAREGRRIVVLVDDRGLPMWNTEPDAEGRLICAYATGLFALRLRDRLRIEAAAPA